MLIRRFRLKPAFSALLALVFFGTALFASSNALHTALHAHGPAPHSDCALCLLAHGMVDAADSSQPRAVTPVLLAFVPCDAAVLRPPNVNWSVAPTRGPPFAFIVSL
jgi:hypothetical protein